MIFNQIIKNINNNITVELASTSPDSGVTIEDGAIYIGYAWNKTYGFASAYVKNETLFNLYSANDMEFGLSGKLFKHKPFHPSNGAIFKITFN